MIFLPKRNELYFSSLRLFLQKKVLKNGNNEKLLSQLKLVSLAEALHYKEEKSIICVKKLSASILNAAVLILMQRGISLTARINGRANYNINRKLYTAILCELASLLSSDNINTIRVELYKSRIIIKAVGCGFSQHLRRLLNALNGSYLYEKINKKVIITIPAKATHKDAPNPPNEWCYILDRFSPINIWLLNY